MMKYNEISLIRSREGITNVYEDELIEVDDNFINNNLEVRSGGLFHNKSIYVNEDYDWIFGKDDYGYTILIPIKKRG